MQKSAARKMILEMFLLLLKRSPLEAESLYFSQILIAGGKLERVRSELMDSHEFRLESSRNPGKKQAREFGPG